MSTQEITFIIQNAEIVARVWGDIDPAKPGVIALHGWLDNAASFDVLAPALRHLRPDLTIIALDMPGHGFSAHKPPQATYHFWDDLLDILCLADHIGWQKFHLLGHSRGAIMGLLLAHGAGERIIDLVLLDALWGMPQEADEAPRQMRDFIQENRAIAGKRLPVHANLESAIAARCRGGRLGISPEAARPIVERGLKPVAGGFTWRTDPRLMTASALKLSAAHNREFVVQLKTKSLLLLADKGIGERPEILQALNTLPLPDCFQWDLLPGSHHFHLDGDVDDISRRVAQFWSE
jgi:pimeloyl-ACP methyl ester carboxylesterase